MCCHPVTRNPKMCYRSGLISASRKPCIVAARYGSASSRGCAVPEAFEVRRLITHECTCCSRIERLTDHGTGLRIRAAGGRHHSGDNRAIPLQRLIHEVHLVAGAIDLKARTVHGERSVRIGCAATVLNWPYVLIQPRYWQWIRRDGE